MSFFDLYRADERDVQRRLEALRVEWPHCVVHARIDDGVIVLSGEVDTEEERHEILEYFRSLEPDRTAVVAGALRRRPQPANVDVVYRSRPPANLARQRPSSSTRATKRIYRVQPGDTLAGIAGRFYGDRKGYLLLAAANGELIERPGQLVPGWVLEIPETFPYTVREGESLESLADRFYSDSSRAALLLEANNESLGNNEALRAGTRIQLPFQFCRPTP